MCIGSLKVRSISKIFEKIFEKTIPFLLLLLLLFPTYLNLFRASSLQSMVFFFSADLPLELMQLPFVNLLINLYLSNLYNFLKRLVFARKDQ